MSTPEQWTNEMIEALRPIEGRPVTNLTRNEFEYAVKSQQKKFFYEFGIWYAPLPRIVETCNHSAGRGEPDTFSIEIPSIDFLKQMTELP